MSVCYCSNFYSSIRCTNTVGKFGQRCKLCIVLKSGMSLTPGRLPEDSLWLLSQAQARDPLPENRAEGISDTFRRPSWPFPVLPFPYPTRKPNWGVWVWNNGTYTRM
ncbi:hypothetical protein F5144DRAFT_579294 [Chaetomium tenue]|uniref:Uncharacterized protein n=1 Tax=Chaetomium tenue TaxID=1854479 RepID=A0ACB7P391_9PEZI|nr:hypothetical protein F5144DRAFT_579294 [Chaetomium globosum]